MKYIRKVIWSDKVKRAGANGTRGPMRGTAHKRKRMKSFYMLLFHFHRAPDFHHSSACQVMKRYCTFRYCCVEYYLWEYRIRIRYNRRHEQVTFILNNGWDWNRVNHDLRKLLAKKFRTFNFRTFFTSFRTNFGQKNSETLLRHHEGKSCLQNT